MKKILFVVINMILLAGSMGFGFYAYSAAGRYFARGVVYIAPRVNESRLFFNPADVELLEISFPDYAITAVSRGGAWLASSAQEVSATVIYTNAAYFEMHAVDFIEGSHAFADENSMIVNEALAWRLFGTAENITGLTIWVAEEKYIISGVARQNSDYTAWVPRGADSTARNFRAVGSWLPSSAENMPVSALYIRPLTPDPLAENTARTMLAAHLRGNPADYAIVDINRFVESINIRFRLLLYLLWLTALIIFLRMAWTQKSALPVIGAAISLFVLWGVNDILLWLPNLSALDRSLFAEITAIGVLPRDMHLSAGLFRLSRLSRFANFAFAAGLVGYVNLLIFLRFRKEEDLF